MKEFISAVADSEAKEEDEDFTEFKLDDRTLRSYTPTSGQLMFMLAALGRGQTTETRFAAIINIMLSTLKDDDRDYVENRLLTRDPKLLLAPEKIEEIFEYLSEEWFARPTNSPSDSAE